MDVRRAGVTLPVSVANGGTGGTTAVTAAAGIGAATKLAQWATPVFIAPTGSMANNGAITLGTALDRTYSEGIWLYLPAGAVAAGVPAAAAFRWTVMSSTTLGTVYNDGTFDGTGIPSDGTATAYVTTGPGAYAGVTSIVTAGTITVAANTLGATGTIFADWYANHNGAAGNKTFGMFFTTTAGTDYANVAGSTQSGGGLARTVIRNKTTGTQLGSTAVTYNGGTLTSALRSGTADTTASTTIVFRMTNATATNWMGIVGASFFTAQ